MHGLLHRCILRLQTICSLFDEEYDKLDVARVHALPLDKVLEAHSHHEILILQLVGVLGTEKVLLNELEYLGPLPHQHEL